MSQPSILVRPAGENDLPAVAELFGQLGYPASAADLVRHWSGAFAAQDAQALVATSGPQVLGVVVINYLAPLHVVQPWALISALVVDAAARGAGIGAHLLARAEQEARLRHCSHLELSSSEKRVRAHAFYLRHGYAEIRKRLVKVLPPLTTA